MSHPAASIKSIFSGKTNLDTPENLEPYEFFNNSPDYGNDSYDTYDDSASRFSQDSNYSVNSRNLKNLNSSAPSGYNKLALYQQNSSTNISIASSGSDYQQGLINSGIDPASSPPGTTADAAIEQKNALLQFEAYSRPVSRNSTTSCLSTTATKDGIEGRKLHRYGPSVYSSNIISNMIQSQSQNQSQNQKNAEFFDPAKSPGSTASTPTTAPPVPSSTAAEPALVNNGSQVSVLTTGAQINGEAGKKKAIAIESYSNLQPPISLNEKISLLNTEPGEKRL